MVPAEAHLRNGCCQELESCEMMACPGPRREWFDHCKSERRGCSDFHEFSFYKAIASRVTWRGTRRSDRICSWQTEGGDIVASERRPACLSKRRARA